jgi:hypothetical protein
MCRSEGIVMGSRFSGWTSRGAVSRIAGTLVALVMCGNTMAAPVAAYNTFHGALFDLQQHGQSAGTFSGAFHYDLTDDAGGPAGGGDGLPDHMTVECAPVGGTTRVCSYTPLAPFSSRYFADFSLVLLDGTTASVQMPLLRIDLINQDDSHVPEMDLLTFQLSGMLLMWEPAGYFDNEQLSSVLAQLPGTYPPSGEAVSYAGVDYLVDFHAIGPLSAPEPNALALVGVGILMAVGSRRRNPIRRGSKAPG